MVDASAGVWSEDDRGESVGLMKAEIIFFNRAGRADAEPGEKQFWQKPFKQENVNAVLLSLRSTLRTK